MIELFECLQLGESTAKLRVDRDKGLIHGVKVLGWQSANNRTYTKEGVDPALYEGKVVCTDHLRPGQNRSVRDRVGVLEGVTRQGDGLYAERLRLLNPRGEFEQRLMGAAEHAPHLFGLSHSARGRERHGSKGTVIESVESVQSVDLVGDPATVAGLYESRSRGSAVKKKLSELQESLKAKRPGYVRALKEMAESGIFSPSSMMDDPAPAEAPAESTDHEQALLDAAKACIDDEALDTKAKLAKIKDILKIVDGGSGKSGGNPFEKKDGGDDDSGDDKKDESRKAVDSNLKEENARLKSREMLRALADEQGVKLTKALLESVRPTITEAEAKALIADLKGSAGAGATQRTRSSAPWTEPKPIQEQKGNQQQPDLSDENRQKRLRQMRSTR